MAKVTAAALLDWYDRNARALPWRVPPGSRRRPNPYHVWLSEIMLQQTTVPTVKRYYERFLELWPTVADLAAAPVEQVLKEWAGLGYYARARNLHWAARTVAEDHGGVFPDTAEGLKALPGVGPYTAAAIAAIAFSEPVAVVDGNVERVMARVFALEGPLPVIKPQIRQHAQDLTPEKRAGDYAQAVMDLGATVCTPRSPKCLLCPWKDGCAARKLGIAEELPRKVDKGAKPVRTGVLYWLEAPHPKTGRAAVLLVRRPPQGLLGGMLAFPTEGWDGGDALKALAKMKWHDTDVRVRHTFTHFHLELRVRKTVLAAAPKITGGQWWEIAELHDAGLPTLMKKAVREMG